MVSERARCGIRNGIRKEIRNGFTSIFFLVPISECHENLVFWNTVSALLGHNFGVFSASFWIPFGAFGLLFRRPFGISFWGTPVMFFDASRHIFWIPLLAIGVRYYALQFSIHFLERFWILLWTPMFFRWDSLFAMLCCVMVLANPIYPRRIQYPLISCHLI